MPVQKEQEPVRKAEKKAEPKSEPKPDPVEKRKATLRQRKLTEKASKRQKNVVRNVKRPRKTIFMSWSLML